jgi:hypothetical protein
MTSETACHHYDLRARVLQVFAALEDAGATPIANRDLQAVVYLSNVLSSVWGIAPIEGAVLKTEEGPRSTKVEAELDACIGAGLIEVASIAPDEEHPEKLSATFQLSKRAVPVLQVINSFPDERTVTSFMEEIAFAFVEIPLGLRDDAAAEDAAWTDPAVADNRMVNFGLSGGSENPSFNVVQAFQSYAPEGLTYTRAQKLELYLRLLKRRANG